MQSISRKTAKLFLPALLCAIILAYSLTMVDAAHSDTSNAFQTAVATESSANLFDGLHALEHAEAQIAFGFRPTGTKAAVKTGDYILQSLKDSGWEASEQPFDLNINGQTIRARNIIGTIGKGPVIIVGAHFDTRIFANADPDQNRRLEMVMGANDGASGVAVMLELARVLGQGYKLNREIRFVFFDAEDNGNIPGWPGWSLGAKHYAENLDVKPEYVIILDMIGDKDLNVYYEGQSMKNAPDLMTEIFQAAADLGYTDSFIPELRHTMIDDHVPFIERGIKAIDLIDFDYPYWHTVSDTLDKISAESMEKIGRTVQKYFEQSGVISPS